MKQVMDEHLKQYLKLKAELLVEEEVFARDFILEFLKSVNDETIDQSRKRLIGILDAEKIPKVISIRVKKNFDEFVKNKRTVD